MKKNKGRILKKASSKTEESQLWYTGGKLPWAKGPWRGFLLLDPDSWEKKGFLPGQKWEKRKGKMNVKK